MESNKLTIVHPIMITRADGLTFKLTANSQYDVEEEGFYDAPMHYITHAGGKAYGYKVLSGESYFILFDPMVSFEWFEREGLDKLSLGERAREDSLVLRKSKDHKKETLEKLGHDIKKFERADYNGRWLQKALKERSQPTDDCEMD